MAEGSIIIRRARRDDLQAIKELLQKGKVSVAGLEKSRGYFLVAERNGQAGIIGTAGIELLGGHGVLRSLVIDPAACAPGFCLQLLELLISFARRSGLQNLYMLTGSAAELFQWYGFHTITWNKVPLQLRESCHLRQYSPQEMVIMVLPLQEKVGAE